MSCENFPDSEHCHFSTKTAIQFTAPPCQDNVGRQRAKVFYRFSTV